MSKRSASKLRKDEQRGWLRLGPRLSRVEMLVSAAIFIGTLIIADTLHSSLRKLENTLNTEEELRHSALAHFDAQLSELSFALTRPDNISVPLTRAQSLIPSESDELRSQAQAQLQALGGWLKRGRPAAETRRHRTGLLQLRRKVQIELSNLHLSLPNNLSQQSLRLEQLKHYTWLNSLVFATLAFLLATLLLKERRLRSRLRIEGERFSDSVSNLSEGFALFDERDRLTRWNKAFVELLPSKARERLQGASYEHISRLIYSQDSRDDQELQARLARRRTADEPIQINDAQGRHIAVRERRMDDGGTVCLYLDITEMQRAQRHLRHLASHDTLTGLPNRSHFHTQLNRALSDAETRRRKVAVLFFDLDNFKHVNDSAGHKCGDLLLQAVAHELRTLFENTDQLARLGGDEFAAMLPSLSSRVPVAELTARLLERLREGYLLNETRICVNASIGIALYPEDGEDFNTLLDNADAACLRAKAMGKNGFQFYHADMNLKSARRRRIEHHLKEALDHARSAQDGHPYSYDHSGLRIEYQPQLAIHGGSLAGVEALIRWDHPELGKVSPAEFVPVAEDTGLVIALGDWVIQRAMSDFRVLMRNADGPGTLSVNLSRRQFLAPQLVERVCRLMEEYRIPPHRLVLEITETAVLSDFKKACNVVRQLHQLGIGIALDDFGAGFSSFEALQQFPLDEIKIDQSFVRDMATNKGSREIVRAMIAVARAVDATVVAEGIETPEQLSLLRDMQCDRGQGFYLGEPMSLEELCSFSNSRLQIGV